MYGTIYVATVTIDDIGKAVPVRIMKKSLLAIFALCFLVTACGTDDISDSGNNAGTTTPSPEDAEVIAEKPVIYLYSEDNGTSVNVSLDFNGELTEIIPEFTGDSSWDVTADKDGTIHVGDDTYPYLFWEGEPSFKYDFFTGFCIKGSETESFLDEKLSILGLSDSEKSEFIEYWLPRMKDNEYNVISFQERSYIKNARLTVSPEPDTVIRVFMAWYPSAWIVPIKEQYLEKSERNGFTVVEWGGSQVK